MGKAERCLRSTGSPTPTWSWCLSGPQVFTIAQETPQGQPDPSRSAQSSVPQVVPKGLAWPGACWPHGHPRSQTNSCPANNQETWFYGTKPISSQGLEEGGGRVFQGGGQEG